jgi:endogenous inhibitor of DNA gyrase (YacG/DUF329 family)
MVTIKRKGVVPLFCPVCGKSFTKLERPTHTLINDVLVETTRFNCPECGISIEDTKSNRCPDCQIMCSDIQALNIHRFGGCNAVT